MMNSAKPVVGVLFKVPEEARVKTRLGERIGMRNAAELYALGLGWLFARMRRGQVRHVLFYDPPEKIDRLRELYGSFGEPDLVSQEGKDLGKRMQNALKYLRERFTDPPVLIGSDSPDLPLGRLKRAASALDENDLVLGPARDGGYYLIGTRRPIDPLFENISWSEPTVLETTLERARTHGLSVGLLDYWTDVDTLEDLIEKM